MERDQIARKYHRNGYNCAQAVYAAFADSAQITMEKALEDARFWGGGAKVKCGAVYAAEQIIAACADTQKDMMIEAFEKEFVLENEDLECRRLLGTGRKRGKSCNDYVGDAAAALQHVLSEK